MTTETFSGLPAYLENLVELWEPVGSRVTCNPPPTDTDQDILVLLPKENLEVFNQELYANKWTSCSDREETDSPPVPPVGSSSDVWWAWGEAMNKWEATQDTYGTLADGESFESWRKEDINLIVTLDPEWFDKMMEACEVCKALNVMSKAERIAIHSKIVPKQTKVKLGQTNPCDEVALPSNQILNEVMDQAQAQGQSILGALAQQSSQWNMNALQNNIATWNNNWVTDAPLDNNF
jgi:hypothetical protein